MEPPGAVIALTGIAARPGSPNTATHGHDAWRRAVARRTGGAGWAGVGCVRSVGGGACGRV
jgi:hypothetical protein